MPPWLSARIAFPVWLMSALAVIASWAPSVHAADGSGSGVSVLETVLRFEIDPLNLIAILIALSAGSALALLLIRRPLEKLAKEAADLESILHSLNEMLIVTGPDGSARRVNKTFETVTGWSLSDLRQWGLNAVVRGLVNQPAAHSASGAVTLEGTLVTRERRNIPIQISVARLRGKENLARGGILVMSDVSERRAAEQKLRYMARRDTLTGLANRAVFHKRLKEALAQAKRSGKMVALLLLDVDNFKEINDSLGHVAGDALLRAAAERLRHGTRETDTVARLDGDEFAMIATNLPGTEGAAKTARKLIVSMGEPFRIDTNEIRASIGIGVSVFPADALDPGEMLSHADFALRQAKNEGPGTWLFYDEEMNAKRQARKAMEADLDRALAEGQFDLHYQPKVDTLTGAITGVEALIRWQHPERGPMSPDVFVPIAEATGRISAIGDWLLERAIAQHVAWKKAGLGRIPMAINLSPVQFRTGSVVSTVQRIVTRHDIEPCDIGLEITEGTIIENVEDVVRQLQELREIGYKIFVDDFGTGYSSLAYLKKLPIDALKIDRAFVSRVTENTHDAAIAKAIIDMARSLQLRTIAEGVENMAQMAFLRAQGCGEAQGYLISPPRDAQSFAAWMRERSRTPAWASIQFKGTA